MINKKIGLLSFLAITSVVAFGGTTEASCVGSGTTCSENVTVQVQILPGDVCIGTTGSFNFGQYTVSTSSQTVSGNFTDNLWVQDLKGANSGYYTTVQLSGNLVGPGGASIPAVNVSMRVPSTTVTVIAGASNPNVTIPNSLLTYTPLNSAVTFIRRLSGVNNGLIGRYGSTPNLQVLIPAYQAVGTYNATLVYTIYEN